MRVERLENRRLLAVTASVVDHVLTVTGDANANHVSIGRNTTNNTLVVRSGDVAIKTVNYADVTSIKVDLLGGYDTLNVAPNVERPSTLNGGDGNDVINAGGGRDVVNGGAGNDLLRGGPGGDALNGGDGNDGLSGGPGADVMSGGGGIDTVNYADSPRGVVVTLGDNLANDGIPGTATTPGEHDNAKSDVENIVGSRFGDRLVGTDAPNRIGGGDGNDAIFGNGGNDNLDGGGGDDMLAGGAGNDVLAGGPGHDKLQGGDGDDLLLARDGVSDILDGGGGTDRASRDVGIDSVVNVEMYVV